jgi:hypothetical protein
LKNYIHGLKANAACDLLNHLSLMGIKVGAVGYDSGRGKFRRLIVVGVRESDRAKVPTVWMGVDVAIEGIERFPE